MRLTLLSVAALMVFGAFKIFNYEPSQATAEVDQEQGVYIFYHSKPVMKYKYLGTVKPGAVWEDKPKNLFNKLVKKTREKYPDAQGIIIDNEMEKCDAIKFE